MACAKKALLPLCLRRDRSLDKKRIKGEDSRGRLDLVEDLIKLTGIARLAAEGTLLAGKRRVEYRTLPTRKWLNRCDSERVPFDWSINPYRGCEFGCKYCYARFTHEFLARRSADGVDTEG